MRLNSIIAIITSVVFILFCGAFSVHAEDDNPRLLSVIPDRDNGLMLVWDPSIQATEDPEGIKYHVLRSSDGVSFQAVASRDPAYGLFFLDATGLIPGELYYYKVREFRNDVQIGESNLVSCLAESSSSPSNEFYDEESAAQYLKEQMILRNNNISLIYNAASFPSGFSQRIYDTARADDESPLSTSSVSGDYLRFSIIPGTFKASSGIDGKVGNLISYTFTYTLDYYTSKADELLVDSKVNEILDSFSEKGITSESPDYLKVKAVNDWFCDNVTYNNSPRTDNGNLMITAYDALVRGEAQCYGYVLACYRLLKELGIVTRRVNGTTSVELIEGKTEQKNHAWNIVKSGDYWYNLDVTAASSYHQINLQTGGGSRLYTYRYMLQGTDSSSYDSHTRSGEYAEPLFIESHPMYDSSYSFEPDAPEAPLLTLTDSGSVFGVFPEVNGASGYSVYRDTDPNGSFDLIANTTSPSFMDTSVEPGNEYQYKIQAFTENDYGAVLYSAYSPRRIILIKDGLPELQVNTLAATPTSFNSVTLTWGTVEGADFYAVYRSESENGTYKLLTNTLTSNTFTSKSLACGTTYYYKVKAGKAINGTKVWGEESSIVSATPKLSAPTGVTATPSSSSTVDMHWEKVEGAQYYQVYRMPSPNGKLALLGVYDENTFNSVSRKLGANTTYYYKARCYRWVNGERVFSPFSTVVSVRTFANAKATVVNFNTIELTWDPADGAECYAVYRAESEDGTYKLLTNTLTENTFTSKLLATGTTYYYRIKAKKTVDGEKVWMDHAVTTATPVLPAPTGVTATPSSSSTVDMHWEKVEGAQYYQVYRMPSPNGKLALLGVYDENTFNSVSRKLAANTTYYYKVRCYRWVNGERVFSPFSEVVNAKTYTLQNR